MHPHLSSIAHPSRLLSSQALLFGFLPLGLWVTDQAQAETQFVLQGSADKIDGFDSTHAGRAKNFFIEDNPQDQAIHTIATDWDAGHNPDANQSWPTPDGIISWSIWDATQDSLANRGQAVVNHLGQAGYLQPETGRLAFDTDGSLGTSGYERAYYANNQQSVGPLNLGNNGTPASGIADRQNVLLSQYKMANVYNQGGSAAYLQSATFTVHIDDVINMDLVSTDGVLPSLAFVNVYNGDGNLVDYNTVQSGFDQANQATADATAEWIYHDDGLDRDFRLSDWALTRNNVINGQSTLSFEFDITQAVFNLMSDSADFTALSLATSGDGDFTLASLDRVLTDASGSVLENLLPSLTLTFADPLAGDYNLDGGIDQGDFSVWADALLAGEGNTWVDGNGNGQIDQGDYSIWADAFLNAHGHSDAAMATVATLSRTVPEPAGLLPLAAAGFALLTRRPRKFAPENQCKHRR